MLIELLILFSFIIIVFLFLMFFKPLHVHVILKNTNLDHDFQLSISFYIINLLLKFQNSQIIGYLSIKGINKKYKVLTRKLNEPDKESNKKEEETEEKREDNSSNNYIATIKQALQSISDSKEEIQEIFTKITKLIQFEQSTLIINLGLQDNNLTIKTCTFLWTIFAPLTAFNVMLYLTPEINKMLLKTDINLNFNIYLINLAKILWIILKTENLRKAFIYLIRRF